MTVSPRYFALIPAAGIGARVGGACPKQYLPLTGKPMLRHAVDVFLAMPAIERVVIIVGAQDGYIDAVIGEAGYTPDQTARLKIVKEGGSTRHQTVLNGLHAIASIVDANDWILVHDAARPGITPTLAARLIAAVGMHRDGGLLAMPVTDTIKQSDDGAHAARTVPRAALWAAQTPQMFRFAALRAALERATDVTDEASAMEQAGAQPLLIEGAARNMKVTLPADIAIAELLMKGSS